MIWFAVMLGMNLQTSFLTPPFGFALFYLRSVAPRAQYLDRVTGAPIQGIATGDIYKGAVNFIAIQLIGVAIIVFFPILVMHYVEKRPYVDPASIRFELPNMGGGAPGGMPTAPSFPGLDAPPSFPGLGAPPSFPSGPPSFGGSSSAPSLPSGPPPGLGAPPSMPAGPPAIETPKPN